MFVKNAVYENKSEPFVFDQQIRLTSLRHLHKEIELIYVREGDCVVHADRFCAPVHAGDLFLSFPNQIHYYENCTPGSYLVMIFSTRLLWGMEASLYNSIPENNVCSLAADSEEMRLLRTCYDQQGEWRNTEVAGCLNLLMARLLPRFSLQPRLRSNNLTLKNVLEYCTAHCCENITLDSVANVLHLNKYYVSHLLNSKLGIRFNDYINTLRINEACDLLGSSEDKVADVSETVGFGTIRSFNRAFQRVMKMTPLQYRELQKGQAEADE